MRNPTITHSIQVQTNQLHSTLSRHEIEETARGLALYYKNGKFTTQTFFTKPITGEINWIVGLDSKADVYIRAVSTIGPNLFHVRVLGDEEKVNTMCQDSKLYNLLNSMNTTFDQNTRSHRYLDVTSGLEAWNCIISTENKSYFIPNRAELNNETVKLNNIIVIGNRLLGLTPDKQVVMGELIPDLLTKKRPIRVSLMDNINKLGRVSMLGNMPKSDDSFIISTGHKIYQFNIWGEAIPFNDLGETVQQINSINFNGTRTILATNNGLYEMDVVESVNTIKPTSLPKKIVNKNLDKEFQMALFVEDPYILNTPENYGIIAKTTSNDILFF